LADSAAPRQDRTAARCVRDDDDCGTGNAETTPLVAAIKLVMLGKESRGTQRDTNPLWARTSVPALSFWI
jgi:hypothetical protein